MDQQYKLRKDVDELQIIAAQSVSEVNVLREVTYTKDEVDSELERLRVKSEGLPYFYVNGNGDLMMDISLSVDPYFSLVDGDLIYSSLDVNHFWVSDDGDLWFSTDVVED